LGCSPGACCASTMVAGTVAAINATASARDRLFMLLLLILSAAAAHRLAPLLDQERKFP